MYIHFIQFSVLVGIYFHAQISVVRLVCCQKNKGEESGVILNINRFYLL